MFTDVLPNRAEQNCFRTRLPSLHKYTLTHISNDKCSQACVSYLYVLTLSIVIAFIPVFGFFWRLEEKTHLLVQDEQMDLTETQSGRKKNKKHAKFGVFMCM